MKKGLLSVPWNDTSVQVSSRMVRRYAWTTGSIDLQIGGKMILKTDGVRDTSGTSTAEFEHGGKTHRASLSWRRSSLRSYPVRLEIDGALIFWSRVPVSNWWATWWPVNSAMVLIFFWTLMGPA